MSMDLKSFIEQFVHCQIHMPSYQKELLIPTEAPVYPFQKVAADFFEIKIYHYLVYVDRYSGLLQTRLRDLSQADQSVKARVHQRIG